MKIKVGAGLLAVLALGIGAAVFYVTRSISLTGTPGTPPASQPPVATLAPGDLGALRASFNEASDVPRWLVLLSPT